MSEETKDKPDYVYGVSQNEERFEGAYKSREEAVDEGRSIFPGEAFLLGWGYKPDPAQFIPSTDWVLESMAESALDEAGEAAEEWPDITDEAEKELNELLKAWARKNCPVDFWIGEGHEEIEPEEKP